MTATQTEAIAARIPTDLRAEVDQFKKAQGIGDDSEVVRRALRALLGGAEIPGAESLFTGPQRPGAARRGGRATEAAAARRITLRRGTACFDVAAQLARRGPLTTDEICAALPERPVNGTARRVTDLLEVGYAEEMLDPRTGEPLTRPTRHGASAIVWRLTDRGFSRYREIMSRAET